MKPFSDVKKLMKERGYTDEQIKSAAKQWYRKSKEQHTESFDADPAARPNMIGEELVDFFLGGDSSAARKRSTTPQDYRKGEVGLEQSVSPVEMIVAGGFGQIGKQMARGSEVGTNAALRNQGGWIGNKELPSSKKISVAGRDRYLDLDVVDDLYNSGGAYIEPGLASGLFGSKIRNSLTPALDKHLQRSNPKVFLDKDLDYYSLGAYKHKTNTIVLNKDEYLNATGKRKLGQKTIAHETQHAINREQGEALGSNIELAKLHMQRNLDSDQLSEVLSVAKGRKKGIHRVYKHELGEVDANLTQEYHRLILKMKEKGFSKEKTKEIIGKIDPNKLLNKRYEKIGGYDPTLTWDSRDLMKKGDDVKSISQRPTHNRQNRLEPRVESTQRHMKNFLDQHDYGYFLRKDGSVGVDIEDGAGGVSRHTARTMKELREILGY